MRRIPLLTLLLATLAAPGAQAGVLELRFIKPELFTDASFKGGYRTDPAVLAELRDYFEQLVTRELRPTQVLELEVKDVDLAGQFEPWRSVAIDTRMLRTSTWPRISLVYRLLEGGEILASGTEELRDMAYLDKPNRYPAADRLRHEKALLDAWFAQRIRPVLAVQP